VYDNIKTLYIRVLGIEIKGDTAIFFALEKTTETIDLTGKMTKLDP
jgi:hypothetical protein